MRPNIADRETLRGPWCAPRCLQGTGLVRRLPNLGPISPNSTKGVAGQFWCRNLSNVDNFVQHMARLGQFGRSLGRISIPAEQPCDHGIGLNHRSSEGTPIPMRSGGSGDRAHAFRCVVGGGQRRSAAALASAWGCSCAVARSLLGVRGGPCRPPAARQVPACVRVDGARRLLSLVDGRWVRPRRRVDRCALERCGGEPRKRRTRGGGVSFATPRAPPALQRRARARRGGGRC